MRKNTLKLTAARVRSVDAPERGRTFVYDTAERYLGVSVTSAGSRSFFAQCGTNRVSLGPVEGLTVHEARRLVPWVRELIDAGRNAPDARRIALLTLGLVGSGNPPDSAKRLAGLIVAGEQKGMTPKEARAYADRVDAAMAAGRSLAEARRVVEVEAGPTLARVFADYLARYAKPKKRTWREDEAMFDRNLGHLAKVPLNLITREMIEETHVGIAERGRSKKKPMGNRYEANRCLALLRKVFVFANGKGAPNPCRDIEPFDEEARERVLTRTEFPRFVKAINEYEATTGDTDGADAIRLLLWTGQRKGNVLAMRWADLDLDEGTWLIPAADFKNKQPHAAALAGPALEVVKRRERRSEYVFPGRSGGFRENVRGPWMNILKIAAIDPKTIRPHDLRRTFGTLMAEEGETLEAIARHLGHRNLATTRRYMRMSTTAVRSAVGRTTTAMEALCGS